MAMSETGVGRRHLIGSGLGLGALGVTPARAAAVSRRLPDVVVVGAGAFGGWTALELRERGASVLLVDQYGPGNARAASGDESRLIRASYGDRAIYSSMAMEAYALWHKRQEEFQRRLIFVNGSLREMPQQDIDVQSSIFTRMGLPYEVIGPDEVRARWPQLNYDDVPRLFFEERAGIVKARESMIAVSEVFQRKGGRVRIGRARLPRDAAGPIGRIMVDDQAVSAGQFVLAGGPWLPKVVPEVLGDRIMVPRREMFYVGSPPNDRRYRWEHCPSLSDHESYTAADVDYGIKIAGSRRNVPFDPDSGDRMPTPWQAEAALRYAARRMPGLKGQPIVAARVCQTEYSDNRHYIVDVHPDHTNVLLAGAGSGHAFKMGPALGRYVADRVLGLPTDPERDALFALKAHGPVAKI